MDSGVDDNIVDDGGVDDGGVDDDGTDDDGTDDGGADDGGVDDAGVDEGGVDNDDIIDDGADEELPAVKVGIWTVEDVCGLRIDEVPEANFEVVKPDTSPPSTESRISPTTSSTT